MSSDNISLPLSSNLRIVEFEIYGLIGIRLIEPTDFEISRLENLFNLKPTTLHRTPEISIRFIKKFSVNKINSLGLNSTGYSNDKFYLLNNKNGIIHAQIPFESIGDHCEIECLSGLSTIPLLSEIIMFTLMKKNYLWLHASAFSYKENSILVMGWEKGGKTETLLAFGNQGAQYIGDEMVALSSDGKKMFGIPIPMAIWEWQIKYLSKLIPTIKLQYKIVFNIILIIEKFHSIFAKGRLKDFFPFQILDDALPVLKRKLKIWALPNELFKNQQGKQGSTPDKVFLVMCHNQSDISIEPCKPEEVAQRMAISNQYEQMYFFKYYMAFKFAFPGLRNEFLETIDEKQNTLISQALAGIESYKVLHPYPVSLDELFNKMMPFCKNET
jgi:hypothetical protein